MVDPVWAFSLGVVALLYAGLGTGSLFARLLVGASGAAWGVHLGWHLWQRNIGKPEDARYCKLHQEWGAATPRSMSGFFQVQAAVSMPLPIVFIVPGYYPDSPGVAVVAVVIVPQLIVVAGEALTDRRLRSFTTDPANHGKTCRAGLRHYPRHPNYLFECVYWLAYVPLALGMSWAWLTLLPPMAMAWLLIKASGVSMLRTRMRATRDDYTEYVRTTNVLIPWPPHH